MTRAQKIAKIEYYEFMLARMNLNPRHRWWIEKQLNDLRQEIALQM